ncbi:MAG: hypothetical protein KDD40_02680, partial [Bdellovibrionales bacterium]|nr:hypothetical protein [Bdellovibrionales bacterium]
SYYKELYISLNSSTGQLNFYAKTYEGQAAIPHMLSNQVSDNTYVWDILKTQKLIKMDEYGYRKLKATINLDPKNAYIDIPQDAIFEQPANLEVTKIDKKKLCN